MSKTEVLLFQEMLLKLVIQNKKTHTLLLKKIVNFILSRFKEIPQEFESRVRQNFYRIKFYLQTMLFYSILDN